MEKWRLFFPRTRIHEKSREFSLFFNKDFSNAEKCFSKLYAQCFPDSFYAVTRGGNVFKAL